MAFEQPPIRQVIEPNGSISVVWQRWFNNLVNNASALLGKRVNTEMSIEGGGALEDSPTLRLRNDQENPPPLYYYGTDASGVIGWWPLP